ncbi:LysR substrate-binding domain-containing protein [Raineyella sp. LH-20]|uniref:LysR substrate-binding domain-containing protein n=1 Tax=Raineyella sp. LH-20 TaxID=3081204 RepID=UPI0029557243|nr:LysR substrate-binding domain-containing protein [Raineyella sp. LH-20]WOP17344.1 LysR substrate-binding domain-containing protein [Raineyella sp. LH-20]
MSGVPREVPPPLRIAFVPGVSPDTWARKWRERVRRVPLVLLPIPLADQLAVLRDGRADMALVRLPVEPDGLSVIGLYEEVPVVVVPKDHPVAAYEAVDVADLSEEHLLQDPDEVPAWRDVATEIATGTRYPVPPMTLEQAIATVAAGTGIVIVPMSLARLHQRKDVTARPVTGVEASRVGLAWPADRSDERTDYFIGIVKGRTANSSRSPVPGEPVDRSPRPAGPASGARRPTPRTSRGAGRGRSVSRRGGRADPA